ncbi:Alpha/beta hydrolase family [Leishmania donovani]|uniref:Protein phosphatase methylesterase 1 n=2 Tax=Leishmania donovani TaxID=5661 RepID=A0A504XDW1_LEIDO|nr:Alpha/beta hydrolase family protein [Leishmania donovani]CAJ1991629.1 Alpha/beta hydrolase family [Leishmania donovani]
MPGVSTSPPLPSPEDRVFVNAQGERFHCTTFAPSSSCVPPNSAHDARTPLLLCVHGAGMSGDCFLRMAREIQRHADKPGDVAAYTSSPPRASDVPLMPPSAHAATATNAEAQGDDVDMHVMTYDQRCHGRSTFAGGEDHLSIEVLMRDFLDVLHYAKTELYPTSNVYVLGHSLGGAVVARALSGNKSALERVSGVLLVDVVEGTAQLSLQHMKSFLKNRPNTFPEVKDAEVWFLRMGGMQNPQGAEVSVPPLLQQNDKTGLWQWRTDIRKMESVWDGWFAGLDEAFISLPCAKMLCTANAERLDKTLTVAQMQGKFQFEVIGNGCGHYVMDDATSTVVAKVRRFVKRNEVLTQKLQLMNKNLSGQKNNTTVPPNRM